MESPRWSYGVLALLLLVFAGGNHAEAPLVEEPPYDARPAQASGVATCNGPFAGRRTPTFAELDAILVDHSDWLQDGRPAGDPRRAKLCGANLTAFEFGIDRRSAAEIAADRIIDEVFGADTRTDEAPDRNLGETAEELRTPHPHWTVSPDLRQADLRRANLADADFHSVPLAGAELAGADLRAARLDDADLSDTDLRDADLRGAVLASADLHEADLKGALLAGANLAEADLSGIDLRGQLSQHVLQS